MRSRPLELQPAREFVQRMHELEAELQRARQTQRRLKANPDVTSRWGLENRASASQEEGWFLTYLDVMTLLLVAMIVMLAFSGSLARQDALNATAAPMVADTVVAATDTADAPTPPTSANIAADAPVNDIPALDTAAFPYPAAPADDFEQSAYPSASVAALASAYPTPMDLAPKPAPEPAPPIPVAEPEAEPAPGSAQAALAPAVSPALAAADAVTAPPLPTDHAVIDPAEAPTVTQAPTSSPALIPDTTQSEGESLAAALPLNELGSEVEVIVNQRSVSLRINNEILFGTGQADLSPHGLAVLKRMAEVLSKDGYHIVVEGHTDSVPVRHNGRYPSNWELSTARAGSVVRYLQANDIDKAHLKAVGYADTRPIADNRDADGRARNRRVELVIEKPDPENALAAPDQAAAADAAPASVPASVPAAAVPAQADAEALPDGDAPLDDLERAGIWIRETRD